MESTSSRRPGEKRPPIWRTAQKETMRATEDLRQRFGIWFGWVKEDRVLVRAWGP
jgi:hypothetical protein